MKNIKRVLSVVMIVTMLAAMIAIPVSADANDPTSNLGSNWSIIYGKYSSSTNKVLAPGKVLKGVGFDFNAKEDGSIDVTIPDKTIFQGVWPVAAISSTATTSLAGLNAQITLADDAVFEPGSYGEYQRMHIMWADRQLTTVADIEEADKSTLYYGENAGNNGLRHILTCYDNGLLFSVSGGLAANDNTQVASSAFVYLYDGEFSDAMDQRPGYRWSFVARNVYSESPNGDQTGIVAHYPIIDCSGGIFFSIREDSTLGYVCQVNGRDFCNGKEVGYFPSNTKGSGGWGDFTDEDIKNPNPCYRDSFTYARADIDLSILKSMEAGYVTIGMVGNNNADTHFNYTVETVNGIPAANWNGEAADTTHVHSFVKSSEDCTLKVCSCGAHIASGVDHKFGPWVTTLEPTEEAEGLEERTCSVCGKTESNVLPKLEPVAIPFEDVKDTSWYFDGVAYCYRNGFMNGMDATHFEPKTTLTRAQIVVILANMSGEDLSVYKSQNSFTDVKATSYYHDAVEWAVAAGISSGMGAGTFAPKNELTREQLACMMMSYAQYKGISTSAKADLSGFADASRIHSWATDAMAWAVAEGLISGTTPTTVAPRNTALRCEAASIIASLDRNVINVK